MKKEKEQKLYWRRLDNSAKIFPISAGKKYSTVFRLSVVLKENVNPRVLEKALQNALETYQSFKVRMKAGLFWYYLEHNPKDPIIEEEKEYPCQYINPKTNNNYLFKVTYFEKKINIDIFHSLTDGNSGTIFFKEIIYNYLELMYPEVFQEERRVRKIEGYDTEDSYMKNYDKKAKSNASSKKAYILKGERIRLGAVSAIHEIIDLEALKKESKKNEATITQYLASVLIYSIYEENYKNNKGKKPIKVCIPVNLKKYFLSKTMSNFFSYITLEAEMEKDNLNTFDKILDFVKKDFKKRLNEEEIKKITRFLDVTRLPILFAKNVVLVEGDAELILIPVMLKIKYGIDINKYGISVISMDSCFFDLIAVLFDDSRIKKKCTILTDLDKDYTKNGIYKRRERLSFIRVGKMKKRFKDNKWVKVYTNDHTFEIEFYKNNIEILKTLLNSKKYFKTIDKMNNELNSQDESIKYNRIIKICDKAGKGWLAMDLAEYIQKEKVEFIIPEYIINAITFIFSDP